ncbi:MAG TPA: methyltransferase domain-containing protein [Casimicrobiaceae bacterium]|nr:methyltransferase domain-containing protein [Casimicrobiaceae bacterium]
MRSAADEAQSRPKKDSIALAYASPPWWYDVRGFFILTFAYRSTLGRQVRFFGRNMRGRHLEVAIGTGTLAGIVLRWRRRRRMPSVRLVGIDYAQPMLAGAMRRFAGNQDIELEHADAGALPYPSESFDSANIANSVHCLPDPDAAFREIHRVLMPDGRLAANVLLFPRGTPPARWLATRINAWGMRKGILVSPYSREDVRKRLEAAGFEIVEEQVSGNAYDVVARKPG